MSSVRSIKPVYVQAFKSAMTPNCAYSLTAALSLFLVKIIAILTPVIDAASSVSAVFRRS